MATLKRRAADAMEKVVGARVVRPGRLGVLYEQEFLSTFLRRFRVDMVLDVGANSGQYATMLRERAGYTGAIVSCEPIPEVAATLRQRAESDPLWFVEEAALSSASGEAAFNVMNSDQFSSLMAPAGGAEHITGEANRVSRQVQVRLMTAADVLSTYHERLGFENAFLKMDTQGHDMEVVAGAGPWLSRIVGLQSELSVQALYEGAPRFDVVLKAYEDLGFVLSALFPNNGGNFPAMLEMDCVMHRADAEWTG
ncbi:FkbM family methyltransferase [Nocardioides sp. cx-173]|uniref:FkbM family methyltransferase n=1 Tax=Nocardioides sp. cx-173 TaxID=2898796 RepID=UPI001E464B06|nr:FkbM family methyltransferase [Nocardioides sp. cx-173]MCD4527410.1 FkbM family methyltransferase [Nocardioides sp. cx-173]UGB41251.1 FkbM family methyltransferase [Nocardioides sp. cx-173]